VRLRRDIPHTLAGAYALDALTEPDRARFERHLQECEVCRLEARGLAEAAGRLSAATAVAPPARLRERVLAAAAMTRQQPPVTSDGLPRSGGPGAGRRGIRLQAPRMAVAIAGGCMLVALIVGGLFLHTQRMLHADQTHTGQIAAVLNAPDATMMIARGRAGGTATVVMSHHDRALVLTTARLPALPTGMRYQVWLMGGGGKMRPAGMLPEPHQGMTAPVVVSGVADGDMVGLSMEPASGSTQPTSAPVLMLALPS
jgi:anti-sigma-K factor RskA